MKKAEVVEVIPSKKIVVGDSKAPVTLMEFGDYESEASAKAHEVVKAVLEASLAAAQEGKFWEMHNELFANRHSLGVISLKGHARDAGVKSKKFLEELINGYYGIYVQDDLKEGIKLGVTDLPVFFVNGKRFEQEPTFKNLKNYIKELVEDAKQKAVKTAA